MKIIQETIKRLDSLDESKPLFYRIIMGLLWMAVIGFLLAIIGNSLHTIYAEIAKDYQQGQWVSASSWVFITALIISVLIYRYKTKTLITEKFFDSTEEFIRNVTHTSKEVSK